MEPKIFGLGGLSSDLILGVLILLLPLPIVSGFIIPLFLSNGTGPTIRHRQMEKTRPNRHLSPWLDVRSSFPMSWLMY